MEDYKITYRKNNQIKLLQYLFIALGCLHLTIFAIDFLRAEANWLSYLILVAAVAEILVGIFRYEQYFFPYPELTLTGQGLIVNKNKNERFIAWQQIQEIAIDNKHITVAKENGEEEINIQYLNYGDIQTAKKKIKQFTKAQDIPYHSVY